MGIVLLVLQLIAPNMARAASGGTWVEICSTYGVIEVQMDLGDSDSGTGSVPESTCPECVFSALVDLAPKESEVTAMLFDSASLPSGQYPSKTIVRNPAQFWHECRGPPLGKAKSTVHASRVFPASPPNTGEVPWS